MRPMRHRATALTAVLAAAIAGTAGPSAVAAPVAATVKAPYTVAVVDPIGDQYPRVTNAHLGNTIDVRKFSAGRDDDEIFLKLEVADVLRPRQIRRKAPYVEQWFMLGAHVFISKTEGGLGASLGEITVSRTGMTINNPRAEASECAGMELVVDREANFIKVKAPITCLGPIPGGTEGRDIVATAASFTQLRQGEAPRRATATADGVKNISLADPTP